MTRTHWLALAMLGTVGCSLYKPFDDDSNSWSRTSYAPSPSPSSSSGRATQPDAGARCDGVEIDQGRELLITDPEVLEGGHGCAVPWSFDAVMAQLAGPEASAAATLAWLSSFNAKTRFQSGGMLLDRKARPEVYERLVCPWLKQDPSNECDESCAQCKEHRLDMSKAPFRAVAVVNRLDLRENDATCAPSAAEGRVVFNAVDPVTRRPLPFTAIFEYRMSTFRASAEAWHSMGSMEAAEARREKLAQIVSAFQESGGLLRVRTNENVAATYESVWEMREFTVGTNGELLPGALANTPHDEAWNTDALGKHISSNMSSILAGRNVIPKSMTAGYSTIPTASFRWDAPGVNESVRKAFSEGTCNGCHGGERAYDTLPFRHIALDDTGHTVVSRFLSDPSHPDTDELSAREDAFKRALCNECRPSAQSYYDTPTTGSSGSAGSATAVNARVLRAH